MSPKQAKGLCRFTRELDEKLIELVSGNEVIYDSNHKFYKDFNVRDDVWLAISSIVGKTVKDCKVRWRSLRDLYHRKKKDQKMGKRMRISWEYMDSMSFLEKFTNEKPKTKHKPEDVSEDQDEEEEDPKIDVKIEFDSETPTTSQTQNGNLSDEASAPKKPRLEENNYQKYCDSSSAVLHLLREIRDMTKSRDDPVTAFFDSMAKTVVRFPPAEAAEVKLKVCQIVTEMECKIIEASGNYPDSFESFE
ncbi:transcription factor Adf-1-like [Anthonomus grandis grandis]|uniref:transcription factor Adf-1-like n=1 Tax=Anthonomus grandis grandis TaxID=2921223 RepID=UPI002165C88E|nr:transcription factor Adf-1-like [Anthonomus grandis grandis]